MARPKLPNASVLIRSDYTADDAWTSLAAAAQAPSTPDEFTANLILVNDPVWDAITVEDLLAEVADSPTSYIFLADAETFTHPEHPILAVNTSSVAPRGIERGRTVRVIPNAMWSIENNLSISNLDFADYVENAGADGIFRGF